jgi:hypothetical protein
MERSKDIREVFANAPATTKTSVLLNARSNRQPLLQRLTSSSLPIIGIYTTIICYFFFTTSCRH